jgi:hypothetical protein
MTPLLMNPPMYHHYGVIMTVVLKLTLEASMYSLTPVKDSIQRQKVPQPFKDQDKR